MNRGAMRLQHIVLPFLRTGSVRKGRVRHVRGSLRMRWAACGLALLLAAWPNTAAALNIQTMRLGWHGDGLRLVLEADGAPRWHMFALEKPYRIVVDIADGEASPRLRLPAALGRIADIRFGAYSEDVFRIVLDVNAPSIVTKSFVLKPTASFPYRLVFDLMPGDAAQFTAWRAALPPRPKGFAAAPPAEVPLAPRRAGDTRPVVVVDPGHGGVDPGARGRRVWEKDVVLTFAKLLRARLKASNRYQVYLTRERDTYVPLRTRVQTARRYRADLFISVHADAIGKTNVRGLSIYTLSAKASDKEAAALARQENRADIIAGVDFSEHGSEIANILIDLAQRESKALSVSFAGHVVEHARHRTHVLERPHRYAGFRVLTAPDVPSVLIELGFLTNRHDEALLLQAGWRRKMADALVQATHTYFSRNALARQGDYAPVLGRAGR